MQNEILILMDPPRNLRPQGAIRVDVAWKLFFPEEMGNISMTSFPKVDKFKRWLWEELSSRGGYLTPDSGEPTVLIAPTMTPLAQEFLNRLCSYWSNNVFYPALKDGQIDMSNKGENRWSAPVVNVFNGPGKDGIMGAFHQSLDEGDHTLISNTFGPSRSFTRIYNIKQGNTYSRFHSHSARDEIYLVIEGKGTLRIGDKRIEINRGDLIDKPLGPDISTQFLADSGSDLLVLDIEIGPEDSRGFKDMVSYPDHRELLLAGEGWNFAIPSDTISDPHDLDANYSSGYIRKKDGSWESSEVPGFMKRNR